MGQVQRFRHVPVENSFQAASLARILFAASPGMVVVASSALTKAVESSRKRKAEQAALHH